MTKHCKHCNKEMIKTSWMSKKYWLKKKYCSSACFGFSIKSKSTWNKGRKMSNIERAKTSVSTKLAMQRSDVRERMLTGIKNTQSDSEWKKNQRTAHLGKKHSQSTIKKLRKSSIGRILSDVTKLKIGKKASISMKRVWKDDSYKSVASERMKELWKNDEYRENTRKLVLSKVCARPNMFESRVFEILNRESPNKFKYVGDGSLLINHRSPDFVDEANKIVVLANGVYFHLKKFGLEINDQNKRIAEKKEALPFVSAGYNVKFIWEDEI